MLAWILRLLPLAERLLALADTWMKNKRSREDEAKKKKEELREELKNADTRDKRDRLIGELHDNEQS